MKLLPYLLHALSPLHAGTGQAVDVIDLPIARMRSTGIPILPGSSIKGVLRDARGTDDETTPVDDKKALEAVFGPPHDRASEHAGALVVGDARLVALPVRSFRGTFAWVSSPLLLDLARRDLEALSGVPDGVPPPRGRKAIVGSLDPTAGSLNVHGKDKGARVFLEDLDLEVQVSPAVAAWADLLAPLVAPGDNAVLFSRRFMVVDDETMTFLWETATQVDTRVRLDDGTRTVADKALWIEESLPPETLLLGQLAAENTRGARVYLPADDVLVLALPKDGETLQFGGKASVGRGRCRMVRFVAPRRAGGASVTSEEAGR